MNVLTEDDLRYANVERWLASRQGYASVQDEIAGS
jgi:hypothetical protein